MFWARPKIYIHFVPVQTFCSTPKDDFHSVKLFFCAGTKVFEEALYAIKYLEWLKKFGPAQNILAPVEGQVISKQTFYWSKRGFFLRLKIPINFHPKIL